MSFIFHEYVPITVAHFCCVFCDNLCFSESKTLTAGRFHTHICLSYFDLVFKVVLCVKVNFAFKVVIKIVILCIPFLYEFDLSFVLLTCIRLTFIS